jgi:hypothetical protein
MWVDENKKRANDDNASFAACRHGVIQPHTNNMRASHLGAHQASAEMLRQARYQELQAGKYDPAVQDRVKRQPGKAAGVALEVRAGDA